MNISPSIVESSQLDSMSAQDILHEVRTLEATYKEHCTTFDSDHRRHLKHDELRRVYMLVSRVARQRNKSRPDVQEPEASISGGLVH